MPVYQVDIEKIMTLTTGVTYFWTNVYHVVAADQAAAVVSGNQIVAIEKAVHANNQVFTKMRVREAVLPHPAGSIVVLSGAGTRAAPADVLPAYNTARIDFTKPVGRPCRKYLRLNIGEAEQANGILTSAFLTTLTNSYATPLLALGVVSDNTGDLITSFGVQTPVQMRQLRRGSKRRIAPVI